MTKCIPNSSETDEDMLFQVSSPVASPASLTGHPWKVLPVQNNKIMIISLQLLNDDDAQSRCSGLERH